MSWSASSILGEVMLSISPPAHEGFSRRGYGIRNR